MKTWHKAALITLITFAIGGIYLFSVFEHRRNPGVLPETAPEQNLTPDDVAVVRMKFMTSFDDALKLQGHQRLDEERLHHALFPLQIRPYRLHQRRGKNSLSPAARHQESHQGRAARRHRRRNLPRYPAGLRHLLPAAQPRPLRHSHLAPSTAARKSISPTSFFITTTRIPSTTTGPKTSGPQSTRTRSFRE